MSKTTGLRLSASMIDKLTFPAVSAASMKSIEFGDSECPGLKLAVQRSGSKTFWWRFTLHGAKAAIRLGSYPAVSLAQARKLAFDYRAQVQQGIDPRHGAMDDDPTFEQFAQHYMAYSQQRKRSYRDDASKLRCWLLPVFGAMRLTQIRRRDVDAYLARLRTTHSAATVNRHLTLLSAMGRRAVSLEYIQQNWCAGIDRLKEDNVRQTTLSAAQAAALLQVLNQDSNQVAASAIALLLLTGMRLRECTHARVEHVHLQQGLWHLPSAKTGARYIHLNAAAMAILERQPSLAKGQGWLFPGRNPSKPVGDVRSTFERCLNAAQLPRMRLHDLRHSFASLAVQAGRSLYDVQNLLGHASPSMTTRYAHLDASSLRAASQSVADAVLQAASR